MFRDETNLDYNLGSGVPENLITPCKQIFFNFYKITVILLLLQDR